MKRGLLLAAIAVSSACATFRARGQASMCQPATHSIATTKRNWVTQLVTGTDTVTQRLRTAYDLLEVPASQVVIVTDKKVCSKASTAMAAALSQPERPVWVIRAGPQRFYVYDGYEDGEGGFTPALILNASYQVLRTIAG